MFVVLDTNHFREVAEATARAAYFNRRAEAERAEVFLSIITVQEATSGWLALINSLNAGRNQVRGYASFQKTITAFHKFSILAFDAEAAEIFHQLKREYPRTGTMDLKIAAICMTHEATLLTRNVADFENITGLRVENWLDSSWAQGSGGRVFSSNSPPTRSSPRQRAEVALEVGVGGLARGRNLADTELVNRGKAC